MTRITHHANHFRGRWAVAIIIDQHAFAQRALVREVFLRESFIYDNDPVRIWFLRGRKDATAENRRLYRGEIIRGDFEVTGTVMITTRQRRLPGHCEGIRNAVAAKRKRTNATRGLDSGD